MSTECARCRTAWARPCRDPSGMRQHWAWSVAWLAARCAFLISFQQEMVWQVALQLTPVYPEVCLPLCLEIAAAGQSVMTSWYAVQVCHELMAKAWDAVRAFVHSGHGAPLPKHMLRLLRHTCEHQVSRRTIPPMDPCARSQSALRQKACCDACCPESNAC